MARTSSRVQARERARAARLRLDRERAARDRAVEEAAEKFFVADDKRGALLAQLDAIDAERARAVARLVSLGESASRVSELLEVEPREVRRLRTLSDSDNAPPLPTSAPVGESFDEGSPADGVRHDLAGVEG